VNGDQLVERGAMRLLELADRAAARGDGIGEWLSGELRDDAAFLRKLKPSLVKARAKNNGAMNSAPSNPEPQAPPPAPAAETPVVETPVAESEPTETRAAPPPKAEPTSKQKPKKKRRGPPPVVIVGAALVAGIVLAKVIDWRGHAHPRD
jgi:hypothetical protein